MSDEKLELPAGASPEAVAKAARAWIDANVPSAWLEAARAGDLARLHQVRSPEAYRAWYPRLGGTGMTAPIWPVEYGGLGLSGPQAGAIVQELRSARLTVLNPNGITLVAAAILKWGTEEQKRRYLPKIATNEEVWCQVFSEPGAGSDLAGLATRAERTDGSWLITGQKVW